LKTELGKSPVCILTNLRTGLPRNGGWIRDSGKKYFSYLKLPDCLRYKLQSIQAYS